ncbi:hypothetical protein ACHAXR_004886, partial [Thalassiosira sp. AJA248-18]
MDFFHIPGVEYQVGQLGISDFQHRYWMLNLVICQSENEETALQLLNFAVDLVYSAGGQVKFVLVDGGAALKAAIDSLNISLEEKGRMLAILKSCFSHNTRPPGVNGTSRRGAQGSFIRYLLDKKVPMRTVSKTMDASVPLTPYVIPFDTLAMAMHTKMLSLVYLFNYLPDRETFRHAMNLFIEEFKELIPQEARAHVLENYLDPDKPELIGGRAVGMQGMAGSTNGTERWGRTVKDDFQALLSKLPRSDRENPIHFLKAVGMTISTTPCPSRDFVSAVKPTKSSLHVIQKLSTWTTSTHGGGVFADVAYMLCMVEGQLVNLKDVLGKGNTLSYTVFLPTSRNLFNKAKIMLNEDALDLELG